MDEAIKLLFASHLYCTNLQRLDRKICSCKRGPTTLEHQEYGQTNAVFEKVKVVWTFLSFHLLSHTEAGHMSPILAEFRDGRVIVAVVVRGGEGMLKSIRTHYSVLEL